MPAFAFAPPYAELHALSSFSFQRGASQPDELVERAHALGYSALALTDECSVAGVVRAHEAAQRVGLKLLPGAEFVVQLEDGQSFTLVALAHNLTGWGNLCTLITRARRAAPKGHYTLRWSDSCWADLQHCEVLLVFPSAIKIEAAYAVSYTHLTLPTKRIV